MTRPALAFTRRTAFVFCIALATASLGFTAGCESKEEEEESSKQPATAIFAEDMSVPEEVGAAFGKPKSEWTAFGDKDKLKSDSFDGIQYRIEDSEYTGVVDEVMVRIRADEDLMEAAKAAWGEPVMIDETAYWFDPDAGIRVELDAYEPKKGSASWRPYQEFGDIFADNGMFSFETDGGFMGKAMGDVPDDVVGLAKDEDSITVNMAPLKFDKYWTRVHFYVDDATQVVDRITMNTPTPGDERAAFETAVAASFGEPVEGEDMGKAAKVYFAPETQRRLTLKDSYMEGETEIEIEPYMPLSGLFADDDKSIFSFEADTNGQTWIGHLTEAKFEEIKDPENDWVSLPPSDHDAHRTAVHPKFEDGVLASYRFDLSHDLVPAGKEAVKAAFVEKLGEPTEKKEKYTDKTVYVFPSTPPIAMKEGLTGDSWSIEVPASE